MAVDKSTWEDKCMRLNRYTTATLLIISIKNEM